MPCVVCGNEQFKLKYIKRSRAGEPFSLVKCKHCGLMQVNPQPTAQDLAQYYSLDYFQKRDDRGYNNYLSESVEQEVTRVLQMNLQDLDFFAWERKWRDCGSTGLDMLDIGAASGLVVSYFQKRGWHARGVEIASDLARLGMKKYNVSLDIGDFLEIGPALYQPNSMDLITMWATIEHLPQPDKFLSLIGKLLKPNGRFIVSTCRANPWGFGALRGRKWRYLNVPEHLYCFQTSHLDELMLRYKMKPIKRITYGSGIQGRCKKKVADWLAKYAGLGDMTAVCYEKQNITCIG